MNRRRFFTSLAASVVPAADRTAQLRSRVARDLVARTAAVPLALLKANAKFVER